MITLLEIGLFIASTIIMTPMLIFAVECFAAAIAYFESKRKMVFSAEERTSEFDSASAVVVIPAHDEETSIAQTLQSLLPSLGRNERILVVADNCDDRTASIAYSFGEKVDVAVRYDPELRGKGFALNFALERLVAAPPDVVVILDADCLMTDNSVRVLKERALKLRRPVQALNLTDRETPADAMGFLAILANHFTNLIRPLGLKRLGAPCRLTGTGMAIPWSLIQQGQFAGSHLAEDLNVGVAYVKAGFCPGFVPEVKVASALPPDPAAFAAQRRRWEQGHFQTLRDEVPNLLADALRRRDGKLAWVAADLSIPPLALLFTLGVSCWTACALFGLVAGRYAPLVVATIALMATATAFFLCWALYCRRQAPFSAILSAPRYIARKVPIYLSMIIHPKHQWNRTRRRSAPVAEPNREL